MINVEIVIPALKSESESPLLIDVVAMPRVDDLIFLDVRTPRGLAGRYARVTQVVFLTDSGIRNGVRAAELYVKLMTDDDAHQLLR